MEEVRQAFRRDVIEAIKGALASLDRDCRDDPAAPVLCHTCCPGDYAAHFPGKKSALAETLSYEPDTPCGTGCVFAGLQDPGRDLSRHYRHHPYPEQPRPDRGDPAITAREPGAFLAGEEG